MGKIGQEGSQERTGVDGFIQGLLDRNKALDDRLKQLEADEGGAESIYPDRATLWHDESTVLSGGVITLSITNTQVYNIRYFQTGPANGDSFTQSFILKAGTYDLKVIGETGTDRALIDWYVDNVKVISLQDWYAGAGAANVIKSASVSVVGNGRHVLKGTVNGKHASSTSYFILLTKMWFVSAVDSTEV